MLKVVASISGKAETYGDLHSDATTSFAGISNQWENKQVLRRVANLTQL